MVNIFKRLCIVYSKYTQEAFPCSHILVPHCTVLFLTCCIKNIQETGFSINYYLLPVGILRKEKNHQILVKHKQVRFQVPITQEITFFLLAIEHDWKNLRVKMQLYRLTNDSRESVLYYVYTAIQKWKEHWKDRLLSIFWIFSEEQYLCTHTARKRLFLFCTRGQKAQIWFRSKPSPLCIC